MNPIILKEQTYEAVFSAENGALLSFKSYGREMLMQNTSCAVLEVRLLTAERKFRFFTDKDAKAQVRARKEQLEIDFSDFPDYPGLFITLLVKSKEEGLEWTAKVKNQTDCFVEQIAFPCVTVTGTLQEKGGEGLLFTCRNEGAVIGDADRLPKISEDYFKNGTEAFSLYYPGYVTMQYMAYLTGAEGVYFASHDAAGMPKVVWHYLWKDGLRLDIRIAPCILPNTNWEQNYPIVLRPMLGDWENAAEIYREFLEHSDFRLPPKVADNPRLPKWMYDSPVEVVYPPRSIRGTGYMGPNEFFPYINGVKYLDELSEEIDAKVMTLMPYWEGSGPWGPPFCWPPYGGETSFLEYVKKMHENGHYVGLYCSGLDWTEKHHLVPEYDMSAYVKEHHIMEEMCMHPDGTPWKRNLGNIRDGYNMCSECPQTREIAYDQLQKMLDAGVDFIQYFDQHNGGAAFQCYGEKHGHPACFGEWSVRSIKEIYDHMNEMIAEKGNGSAVIATEGAAADIYCTDLFFNDLRWQDNLRFGIPVPAQNYVMHEYLVNYMGNQCSVDIHISREENPDSLLYALAYSFIAGNALTLVLKSGGEIHYDWGLSWLHPGPKQKPVKMLVKHLNAMRCGVAKDFLIGGRMVKTLPFIQPGTFSMIRRNGSVLTVGEVLSSCWQSQRGEKAQIFANFREHAVTITMEAVPVRVQDWKGREVPVVENTVTIPPLGCVLVSLES